MQTNGYEKRFGLIAVDKGFTDLENLIEAMKIQMISDVKKFDYRLLGEILVDMGALNASQVNEVLNTMNNRDPKYLIDSSESDRKVL